MAIAIKKYAKVDIKLSLSGPILPDFSFCSKYFVRDWRRSIFMNLLNSFLNSTTEKRIHQRSSWCSFTHEDFPLVHVKTKASIYYLESCFCCLGSYFWRNDIILKWSNSGYDLWSNSLSGIEQKLLRRVWIKFLLPVKLKAQPVLTGIKKIIFKKGCDVTLIW